MVLFEDEQGRGIFEYDRPSSFFSAVGGCEACLEMFHLGGARFTVDGQRGGYAVEPDPQHQMRVKVDSASIPERRRAWSSPYRP